jgi:hypothetical protein
MPMASGVSGTGAVEWRTPVTPVSCGGGGTDGKCRQLQARPARAANAGGYRHDRHRRQMPVMPDGTGTGGTGGKCRCAGSDPPSELGFGLDWQNKIP